MVVIQDINPTDNGAVSLAKIEANFQNLDTGKEEANPNIQSHISNTSNPHNVTKAQVGLGNVDNTSDATKNSATATLTNKTISGASNTLTNIPQSAVTNLTIDLGGKANLTGGNTFSGTQNVDSGELYIKESGIPTIRLKTIQPGTREWRISSAYNDSDSISIVDVTASNTQRLILGNDLIINGQNWTSAWTSYTPARTYGLTQSATSVSCTGRYKVIGKTFFAQIRFSGVLTESGTEFGFDGIPLTEQFLNIGTGWIYSDGTGGLGVINCTVHPRTGGVKLITPGVTLPSGSTVDMSIMITGEIA